jgi:hypothetical protein
MRGKGVHMRQRSKRRQLIKFTAAKRRSGQWEMNRLSILRWIDGKDAARMFVCSVHGQEWMRMKAKLGIAVLAAGFVLSAGSLSATAIAQEPSGAFEGQVPVSCSLKKPLSSRNAKVGQDIAAETEHPTTVNGTAIPRGSMLTGHVVDVTPYKKGGQSGSITIVFDRLQPKKGDSFAVEASVYQIALSDNQVEARRSSNAVDMGMRGTQAEQQTTSAVRGGADNMNNRVEGMVSVGGPVKVMSAIPGVALSAAAGGDRSAIMTASKDDVDLAGGTEMVVGVKSK